VSATAAALVATWAFLPGNRDAATERIGYNGIVEYAIRDASGRVKEHRVLHNAVLGEALETAMKRLIDPSTGVTADTDTFRRIGALNTNTDDPVDGVLAASVTTLLDGDTGAAGDQNPANAAFADVGTTTDGQGRVQLTFTATGNASIRRIVLTKAPVDNTADGAAAITSANILAHQAVTIDLANGDTVQFTWTINLD